MIELLVVISIIGLLIGILLPAIQGVRIAARQMESNARTHGMVQAMVTYAQANDGLYPGLGANPEVTSTRGRMQVMLEANLFTAEYAHSPFDRNAALWRPGDTVDSMMYSYALLSIEPGEDGRRSEWSQSLNSSAVLISDRDDASNPAAPVGLYPSDTWVGTVAWGDGHSGTEQTHVLETTDFSGTPNDDDNLFTDEAASAGSNAMMLFD